MRENELAARKLVSGVRVSTPYGDGYVNGSWYRDKARNRDIHTEGVYYSQLMHEWRCHVWIDNHDDWISLSCEKVVPVECSVPDGMQETVAAFLSESED